MRCDIYGRTVRPFGGTTSAFARTQEERGCPGSHTLLPRGSLGFARKVAFAFVATHNHFVLGQPGMFSTGLLQ